MTESNRSQALIRTVLYIILVLPFAFLLDFLLHSVFLRVNYPDLSDLLWHAGFFAVGLSVGLGVVSYFAFRNVYSADYNGTSGVDRSAYVEIQLPYKQAFDRCLISLRQLGNPTILLEDRRNGKIEAVVHLTKWWEYFWKPWGQRNSFRLGSDQEGSTRILVTSRAPLSTVVVDFGRNKKNVERIEAFLQGEVTA